MNFINSGSTPDRVAWRIAKTTYVVLCKGDDNKLNLIVDPGLGKPWSSRQKRMAEQVATECDGMAATFEEALRLLIKDQPDFEKSLYDRIEKKHTAIDALKMKHQAEMIQRAIQKANKSGDLILPGVDIPKNDVNPINPEY